MLITLIWSVYAVYMCFNIIKPIDNEIVTVNKIFKKSWGMNIYFIGLRT